MNKQRVVTLTQRHGSFSSGFPSCLHFEPISAWQQLLGWWSPARSDEHEVQDKENPTHLRSPRHPSFLLDAGCSLSDAVVRIGKNRRANFVLKQVEEFGGRNFQFICNAMNI